MSSSRCSSCRRPERAALIGQLYAHDRGQKLADLLADVEADDRTRLRLIAALREVLG